jgi:hypothetical protein
VVWDAAKVGPQATIKAHATPVRELRLDGDDLVTVSADGVALRWDLGGRRRLAARVTADTADRELPGIACAAAARDLTPAEWYRHLPDRPYTPTCA